MLGEVEGCGVIGRRWYGFPPVSTDLSTSFHSYQQIPIREKHHSGAYRERIRIFMKAKMRTNTEPEVRTSAKTN